MRTVIISFVLAAVAMATDETGDPKSKAPAKPNAGPKLWAAVGVSDAVLDWDNFDIPSRQLDKRGPFMIFFYLVNDGDKVVDPRLTSSRLFINGKECTGKDGGVNWLVNIGNGPRDDRWEALPPGDYLAFGYAMGEYFKEPGRYRVKWQGEGFAAPEVEFRVMPRKKAGK